MKLNKRFALILAGTLALTAIGATQIRQVIKIVGVAAAVKQFGPDINKAINKLSGHKDSAQKMTKVVPILVVGLGKNNAIGAAQVTGTRTVIDQVEAVASPEAKLFGNEIRVRALIPVSSKDVDSGLKTVDGVGVTGIVDLKL